MRMALPNFNRFNRELFNSRFLGHDKPPIVAPLDERYPYRAHEQPSGGNDTTVLSNRLDNVFHFFPVVRCQARLLELCYKLRVDSNVYLR